MSYTLELDHGNKLIRYVHPGVLVPEDIGAVWEELLSMEEFTEKGYHLLSDYRNATFSMEMSFLPDLLSFMSNLEHILRGKKQSLIVEDAFVTAVSLLFQNEVNAKVGFQVKVFSTIEAAEDWLLDA